jgi:hypothetical protein
MPNLNLTKLVTNQDTFGEMVEKINSNFDIVSQAQGLRGEEGKRGTSGVPGPPGVIGPIGSSGSAGERGSRWYFGDSFTAFDKTSTKTGDFFLEGDTGSVYEKIAENDNSDDWFNLGTIVGSGSGGSSLFEDFIPTTNNKTTIIKPLKTNYTLEITDITGTSPNFTAEPFSSIGADTSDFVMGGSSTTQNWLQEMGLKIYTSESDTLSAIYGKGKNLHLSNSTAFVYNKLLGWQNQSGFTLTVDWGGTGNRHEETLKISNVASGNIDHKQIIDLTANEIQFNADETFVNSPFILHSLSTVNINSLTSPNAGTLVYDTTANAVFSYEGSPLSWKKLSATGTGGGGDYFELIRTFDSDGADKSIDESAGLNNNVIRIKEGNGIRIDKVPVADGVDTYDSLEIRLNSSTTTATDYFGTAHIYDDSGNMKGDVVAVDNDDIKFQEGDDITIVNNDGKIKISYTGTGGSSAFLGFKYKFGQNGPATSPFATDPLRFRSLIVSNNGLLATKQTLTFDIIEIGNNFSTVTESNGTIFTPGKAGHWQINAFAFGLVELPNSVSSSVDYFNSLLLPYTIAGGIVKNNIDYSYLTIAEGSTVSPLAIFGDDFDDLDGSPSGYPWPSWTLNCSDIVEITDDISTISIDVGCLYAPLNGNYNPNNSTPNLVNLWYLSGFLSATYLGT